MRLILAMAFVFSSFSVATESLAADISSQYPVGCGDFQGESAPAEFIEQILDFYSDSDSEFVECPLPSEAELIEIHHRRGRHRHRRPRRRYRGYYPPPAAYGWVCRNGYYFCAMWTAGVLGTPCTCPGFYGYVTRR